jgi:hypothetical protein
MEADHVVVIGIPTLNPMGIYLNQRNFWTAADTGFFTNTNRVFPGELPAKGGNNADLLAYNVWNNVWGNTSQVDVGIDLREHARFNTIDLSIDIN